MPFEAKQCRRRLFVASNPKARFAVLFAMLLGLASCDRHASSTLKIIGGHTPELESPEVYSSVALVSSVDGVPFCSGTYIAKNLIVTAAHCVIDKANDEFKIMFGTSPSSTYDVTAYQTYKDVQKFESNFDIAWVKFEGVPPADFHPIEILQSPAALKPGASIRIAGYGYTQYPCGEDGVPCRNALLQSLDTFIQEYVSTPRLYSLISVNSNGIGSPCFGDSGGPAFTQIEGRWYLAGEFMGWDRLLVPENLATICGTGQGIYTFIGNYTEWLETSSQTTLTYDKIRNPKIKLTEAPETQKKPHSFFEWCEQRDHTSASWYTVQKIIRLASDFRIKTDDPLKARELFESCSIAEIWVKKMLETQGQLTLDTFDQYNSNYSAKVEDLTPLLSLIDMGIQTITIKDSAIQDFRPLASFPQLRSLEIRNNEAEVVFPLDLANFKDLRELRLENSKSSIAPGSLSSLKGLTTLELSSQYIPTASKIELSHLEHLYLNNVSSDVPWDLSMAVHVRTLFLSATEIAKFPEAFPEIIDFSIRFSKALPKLPLQMPKLTSMNLYALDLSGSISLKEWKNLEELTISSNANLNSLMGIEDLPKLSKLVIIHNGIQTIGRISGTPGLTFLDLSGNRLTQLPELEGLDSLQEVNVSSNRIQIIPALPKNLKKIDASDNPLTSLEGLNALPQLQSLTLDHIETKGLAILENIGVLNSLEELSLTNNTIKDLRPLLKFPNLKTLFLDHNLIEDLSPLRALGELIYLQAIGNPLRDETCPHATAECRLSLFPHLTLPPSP